MQLAFAFDVSRCSGCMACIVACLDGHDLQDTAHAFRHVSLFENGQTDPPTLSFISLSCFHCGDAPCMMVCPTGSVQKRDRDGIVTVNRDFCIGCHSCVLACPFGAPQFPKGHSMAKCDFCVERIEAGLEPACVRVCPTRALRFGPVEELTQETARKASRNILKILGSGPAGGRM